MIFWWIKAICEIDFCQGLRYRVSADKKLATNFTNKPCCGLSNSKKKQKYNPYSKLLITL